MMPMGTGQLPPHGHNEIIIREVWANNLEEEFAILRDIIEDFPVVSMDIQFPGIVARPLGVFKSNTDYHYQTLRCNVDLLKIIQLGISLTDQNGKPPPNNCCCWQFNFKFDLKNDMYSENSIKVLENAGINFDQHLEYGIEHTDFGELLMSSGLVLLEHVKWVSFSVYHFAYLMKTISCEPLPEDETEFFEQLLMYFPTFIEIKLIMKNCFKNAKSMQDLADALEVERIGPQHQAGSDSLLTCATYFKLQQLFLENRIDEQKFLSLFYGYGSNTSSSSASAASQSHSTPNASRPIYRPSSTLSPSPSPSPSSSSSSSSSAPLQSPESARRSLNFSERIPRVNYKDQM